MKIRLNNIRLSFPALFIPQRVKQKDGSLSEPAYSASFLIHPDDPQVQLIWQTIETVAAEKWRDQFREKYVPMWEQLKAKDLICLHNGDFKAEYEDYPGNWYLTARSSDKPLILNLDKSELKEGSGRPYGGCYVNVVIDIYAQDNQWGKRVNATLKGVQFYRDGDAFAAGPPATPDDFEDLSVTSGEGASLM